MSNRNKGIIVLLREPFNHERWHARYIRLKEVNHAIVQNERRRTRIKSRCTANEQGP